MMEVVDVDKLEILAMKAMGSEKMTDKEVAELETLTKELFKLPEKDMLDIMANIDVKFLLNRVHQERKSKGG